MSVDVRRFDILARVVRDQRRRLDDFMSTVLARLGSHTHSADAPPSAHGFTATPEGTTSATFADLATVGPSGTVTVGASGAVLVLITAQVTCPANEGGEAGVATSGATVRAADADRTLLASDTTGTTDVKVSSSYVHTGLATGSTTFTMKYRRSTGAGTVTFADRQIVLIPL